MRKTNINLFIIAICCFSFISLSCQWLMPGPELPISLGTKLPPGKSINLDNYKKIVEIAQWHPETYAGYISVISTSPDGKYVATGFGNGSYSIFDLKTGVLAYQKHYTADTDHGAIRVIEFIIDSDKIFLGYDDGFTALCQIDGTVIWETYTSLGVNHASILGNTVAIASSFYIYFISLEDGKIINEIILGTGVEFISEKQFILGTLKGHVELWQFDPLLFLSTIDKGNENSTTILLSNNKEIILAHSDNDRASGDVRIIRAQDGTYTYITALWASMWITDIVFSPDSEIIATASFRDTGIQLWRASDGYPISRLLGHTMSVNALAFSPDGKNIISGGHDGTIRVWGIP
jgi:WD40 repeat protein